MFFSLSTIQSF